MSRVRDFCHQLRSGHSDDASSQANDDSAGNKHAQILGAALKGRANDDQESAERDRFLPPENLAQLRGKEGGYKNTDINRIDKSSEVSTCLSAHMLVSQTRQFVTSQRNILGRQMLPAREAETACRSACCRQIRK